MKRVLGGFHHKVARRLTGRQPWKGRGRGWVYPPVEDTMAEVGLQELETHVSHHQNTVAQYIATRPIMGLCLAEKRRPGKMLEMRWWEQEGLDLEGIWTAAQKHIWDLPILCYHKIMVIYPYPFLVVITLLFSWIIFINDCICILTGSPNKIYSWSYILYTKTGVTRILQILSS